MFKNKIIIVSIIISCIFIVSCNIFQWTNVATFNAYELVREGEGNLTNGDYDKARKNFLKAIEKFENMTVEEDDKNYLSYKLYHSRAYRGLATSYIAESLKTSLILDFVTKFTGTPTAEEKEMDILNYLYSETYPDETERKKAIENTYSNIMPRYRIKYRDGNESYAYKIDEDEKDLPLDEKRGAAASLLIKSNEIASEGYTKGKAMNQDELSRNQKDDLDSLKNLTIDSGVDSLVGTVLGTLFLAMDSNFNFEVDEGDYIIIKSDMDFDFSLMEDLQENMAGGTDGEEADDLKEKLDFLTDFNKNHVPNLRKFSRAILSSIGELSRIKDNIEKSVELPDEFNEFLDVIMPPKNDDGEIYCAPDDEGIYCMINKLGKAIDGLGDLIAVLRLAISLQNMGNSFNTDGDGPKSVQEAIDDMTDDEAEVISNILGDGDGGCRDGEEINFDKEGCSIGSIGDLAGGDGGDMTEAAGDLNEDMIVYDNLPEGLGSGDQMLPAKRWRALEIMSNCKTQPTLDECKFLDDIDAKFKEDGNGE